MVSCSGNDTTLAPPPFRRCYYCFAADAGTPPMAAARGCVEATLCVVCACVLDCVCVARRRRQGCLSPVLVRRYYYCAHSCVCCKARASLAALAGLQQHRWRSAAATVGGLVSEALRPSTSARLGWPCGCGVCVCASSISCVRACSWDVPAVAPTPQSIPTHWRVRIGPERGAEWAARSCIQPACAPQSFQIHNTMSSAVCVE